MILSPTAFYIGSKPVWCSQAMSKGQL